MSSETCRKIPEIGHSLEIIEIEKSAPWKHARTHVLRASNCLRNVCKAFIERNSICFWCGAFVSSKRLLVFYIADAQENTSLRKQRWM